MNIPENYRSIFRSLGVEDMLTPSKGPSRPAPQEDAYSDQHHLGTMCEASEQIIAGSRPGDEVHLELEPGETRRVVRNCLRVAAEGRGMRLEWKHSRTKTDLTFILHAK